MPIYEYVCLDCGIKFDALRAMKDADVPISCNSCHSFSTKRSISLCYAQSDGKIIAGKSECTGCAGGNCTACGH